MPLAEDEHPVGDLGPGGEHEPLRKSVRARASGWDLHGLDAGSGEDRVERVGELPGPVADQELEVCGAVAEVHQEVANLLGSPRAVRVRGYPGEVHIAGADFDDEQAVQALQRQRAVHVEEIGGERGRGLGLQELPPGRVGVPFRRGRYAQCLEDPADRGGADPVPEFQQLALDPLVSPAVVLSGEPLDQHGDLSGDRRAARPVRVSPLPGNQAAVPAKHGLWCNQPVRPQASGQEPDQHGEDRAVSPVQAWPGMGTAQHRNLVPQHEQLDVLGRRRPAEQDQPAAKPGEGQVEQAERHR